MLDRAVGHYEEADFKAALRTFDAAARNADLSVEELLRLFEMRALVYHALGDSAAMREDLLRVAAVRPSYRLGPLAPPPVREALDRLVATNPGIELQIEEKTVERVPSMVARVVRVPDQLVDHVTLNCSVGANRVVVSRTSQGSETMLPLTRRGAYERCEATARTRQGGVLFRAVIGEPLVTGQRDSGVFATPSYVRHTDTTRRKRWPWFVAAAAVVVAGGVAAGVVLSKRSSDEQPTLGGATVSW